TLLWPGDIEARVERMLAGKLSPVDAVLAPHHGSRTSSTKGFVRALRPRLVVAQAGKRNRFGFPHPEVVARWRKAGARVLTTAEGAVEVDLKSWRIRRFSPPASERMQAGAMFARWLQRHLPPTIAAISNRGRFVD
ncbi:MAG: hypothetical protein D6771_07975, partial [Zetaproteobacteria bacterium]